MASAEAPGDAPYVLGETGFARSDGKPCAACLGALLASQPPAPEAFGAAASLAAGSLAAADLLDAIASPRTREPLALVVWPEARRLDVSARVGCCCG